MRRVTVLFLIAALGLCCSARADQRRYNTQPIQPAPVPPVADIELQQPKFRPSQPKTRVAVTDDETAAAATESVPAAEPAPKSDVAEPAEPASPAEPSAESAPAADGPAQMPVARPTRRVEPQRQGFFDRLMQLERRKNAWLRRTFLR